MQVGDTAEWESQGQGKTTIKRGTVLYLLPPKISPARMVMELGKTHRVMFKTSDWSYLHGRDHESYLISVKRGKTEKSLPGLYWPDTRRLRKVDA